MKKLYIVGSGFLVKMTLKLFKAFVSSKCVLFGSLSLSLIAGRFWKKLQRIQDPNDLHKYVDLAQLKLPDAVFKYDDASASPP